MKSRIKNKMTSCMFEYPHAAAEKEGFAQSKQTVTTSRNLRGNLSQNCEIVINLITVDTCLCLLSFICTSFRAFCQSAKNCCNI